MIRVRGARVRYGAREVLDGVDLDVPYEGVVAVLGPNGSGKTTLGRLVLGLERASSGRVEGLDDVRRAAVFQEDRLVEHLSAVANVLLVLPRGAQRADVVVELRALGLPDDALDSPVRALSGGQRRRVALARGLLAPAELVVLDEPFTGLDNEGLATAREWVRAHCAGRAALLITHDPQDVARFDAHSFTLRGAPTA